MMHIRQSGTIHKRQSKMTIYTYKAVEDDDEDEGDVEERRRDRVRLPGEHGTYKTVTYTRQSNIEDSKTYKTVKKYKYNTVKDDDMSQNDASACRASTTHIRQSNIKDIETYKTVKHIRQSNI